MTTERTGHAPTALRERRKRLAYQAVSDAAIAMFLGSCTGSPTTRTRPPAW